MDLFVYLTSWVAWLRSMTWWELVLLMWPFVLLELPRYAASKLIMMIVDLCRGYPRDPVYSHCPTVVVVLAGYNEADTVGPTIESILGTYPRLEIIVVDDGSEDGMSDAVAPYAERGDVRLLRKPDRGGKSSCVNFGVAESTGEVILVVDTDSSVEPNTIWEIVQPFADPRVGAVGGTIRVRNARSSLATMCQAYEYLHAIFLGRQVASRLGIMSVASGALGAFRREAVERAGGWDVGPGEDGDITIKVRKLGYKAVFAPYAVCHTDVPHRWIGLFRQRRRWNRGLVRYKCRKHADMANPLSANFQWGNLFLILNVWFFKIGLLLAFWVRHLWLLVSWDGEAGFLVLTTYATYQCFNVVQVVAIMYYSDRPLSDLTTCCVVPFTPFYRTWLCTARLVSVTEETFYRRSFQDDYVPPKVRAATIHW